MTTRQARVASKDAFSLGEGPVWDPAQGRVLWVDVHRGEVLEGVTPAAVRRIPRDPTVSPTSNGARS